MLLACDRMCSFCSISSELSQLGSKISFLGPNISIHSCKTLASILEAFETIFHSCDRNTDFLIVIIPYFMLKKTHWSMELIIRSRLLKANFGR